MLFSVNQASQLYVVDAVMPYTAKTTPEGVGTIKVNKTDDSKFLYFTYMGKGGLLRSDLIPIDTMDIKFTGASAMKTPLRRARIQMAEGITLTRNQDYIICVKYSIGSIDNQFVKYGITKTLGNINSVTVLMEKLAESINKNFERDEYPAFRAVASGEGMTIVETEPKWILGTYPQRPINFEVYAEPITSMNIDYVWADITYDNGGGTYVNSKKIADLEWFCMGERGDQYKGTGWPNVIPTEYMVNPLYEFGYDVCNIHFAYTGSNESPQKSEKDIILVFKSAERDVYGASTLSLASEIEAILGEDITDINNKG